MTRIMNRRQFERLSLDGALAYDEAGRELGPVTLVGGGGIGVALAPRLRLEEWPRDKRLRLTVVEHASNDRYRIDFVVRYLDDGLLGLQFAEAES